MNEYINSLIKTAVNFKEREILTEIRNLKKKQKCSLLVIDNFLENPLEYREFALSLDFIFTGSGDNLEENCIHPINNHKKYTDGLYPGMRTYSYGTEELKNKIQNFILPFGGKITEFFIPEKQFNSPLNENGNSNGCFQYTTSFHRSYIHADHPVFNWAGVLYLTPNAPENSGTNFYKFIDGSTSSDDSEYFNLKYKELVSKYRYDNTKWKIIDSVGNKFNRLILFNPRLYHKSGEYFGKDKTDGRLFQVFFFTTEF
jgi:hypothetical protein